MPCAPEPNYHGRQLIRDLKTLRENASMGQEEVAKKLKLTLQKVSRFENGQVPGYHELCAMLDLYALPSCDWDSYLELWDKAKKRGWWRQYGLKDSRYVRMEDEASVKYEFQLGHLPALLQTERYAHDVLSRTVSPRSEKTIANEVAVRMRQQDRLYSDNKLRLHSLVHETALYQGVDRPQLVRLVQQAELSNVTLQVVPVSSAIHSGLYGSVILLSFDDPREPDIAFAENLLGVTQTQDPERVLAVRRTLDLLASTAMTPDESLDLVRKQIATFSKDIHIVRR